MKKLIALVMLLGFGVAQAVPITWYVDATFTPLPTGTFGTVTGSFDYDASQHVFSNINLVSRCDGECAGINNITYSRLSDLLAPTVGYVEFMEYGSFNRLSLLWEDGRLTSEGGRFTLWDDYSYLDNAWIDDYLHLTGTVSTVPIPAAVDIDIRPSNPLNTVFPRSTRMINVAVLSTSVADGDAIDFDAIQVSPATLRFGTGNAQNIASPKVQDVDGDGDADVVFGFRTQDSGIACGDTKASLTGRTYAGKSFTGMDSIVTADCRRRVDIDIRPSSPLNIVFPTSTRMINVAVLTTSVADGDAIDFDARQVAPATLRFGAGRALNVATPKSQDIDGDGDADVVFGFRTQGSGIACGDTKASLIGKTYSGAPFIGSDPIKTSGC